MNGRRIYSRYFQRDLVFCTTEKEIYREKSVVESILAVENLSKLHLIKDRSSHKRCSVKKGVPKNFAKKHLC